MTAKILPFPWRERRHARELDVRAARAIAALTRAGLTYAVAENCVAALTSGAHDALVRAHEHLSGDATLAVFRAWCVTHGFRGVVDETARCGVRADKCSWCGRQINASDRITTERIGTRVLLRCDRPHGKLTLDEALGEYDSGDSPPTGGHDNG